MSVIKVLFKPFGKLLKRPVQGGLVQKIFSGESRVSRFFLGLLDYIPLLGGAHNLVRKAVRKEATLGEVLEYVHSNLEVDRFLFGLVILLLSLGTFYFGWIDLETLQEVIGSVMPFIIGLLLIGVVKVKTRISTIPQIHGQPVPEKKITINGVDYELNSIYEVEDKFYKKHQDIFKQIKEK